MSLKINYLALRARGEPIFLILEYTNIPYTTETFTFTPESWVIAKKNPEIAPYEQLPSLVLPTGEVIAESGTIIRYLAKIGKIYPSDPLEAAKSDMVLELAQELVTINPLVNFWAYGSPDYESNYKTYFDALPGNLKKLERHLGTQNFFGGKSPLFGDFAVFHILDLILFLNPSALDEFPTLTSFVRRVESLPAIRKYLDKRPKPNEVGVPNSFINSYSPKK